MTYDEILQIADRDERQAMLTSEAYDEDEELGALVAYCQALLQFPFAATWRDPDEPGHAEAVQVLGINSIDDRRGLLLQVRRASHRERRVLAEQLRAAEPGVNATVLDDYRYWLLQGDTE